MEGGLSSISLGLGRKRCRLRPLDGKCPLLERTFCADFVGVFGVEVVFGCSFRMGGNQHVECLDVEFQPSQPPVECGYALGGPMEFGRFGSAGPGPVLRRERFPEVELDGPGRSADAFFGSGGQYSLLCSGVRSSLGSSRDPGGVAARRSAAHCPVGNAPRSAAGAVENRQRVRGFKSIYARLGPVGGDGQPFCCHSRRAPEVGRSVVPV